MLALLPITPKYEKGNKRKNARIDKRLSGQIGTVTVYSYIIYITLWGRVFPRTIPVAFFDEPPEKRLDVRIGEKRNTAIPPRYRHASENGAVITPSKYTESGGFEVFQCRRLAM
jgi:hypothetical protein